MWAGKGSHDKTGIYTVLRREEGAVILYVGNVSLASQDRHHWTPDEKAPVMCPALFPVPACSNFAAALLAQSYCFLFFFFFFLFMRPWCPQQVPTMYIPQICNWVYKSNIYKVPFFLFFSFFFFFFFFCFSLFPPFWYSFFQQSHNT